MNQQDNYIDIYVKTYLEDASVSFNKQNAWFKLEKKRNHHRIQKRMYLAVAASILFLFALFINYRNSHPQHIVDEFQKRQKLEEFEKKLSGTYEELELCFDCNGTIIKSKIKQVPDDPSILLIN